MYKYADINTNNIHLDILFHRTTSEWVLRNIIDDNLDPRKNNNWRYGDYKRFALNVITAYSENEIDNFALDLKQKIDSHNKNFINETKGDIFDFLGDCCENYLVHNDREPLCRFEYFLKWREISKSIGEDIFTTAFLAKKDQFNSNARRYFQWPTNIKSDNIRLRQLLSKGISENHYHLNGSIPVYFVSWVSLMNHPLEINTKFKDARIKKEFKEKLNPRYATNSVDNLMSLEEKLIYAAYIRTLLFKSAFIGHTAAVNKESLANSLKKDFFAFNNTFVNKMGTLNSTVSTLRYLYGVKIPYENRESSVLDYAINYVSINNDAFDQTNANRLFYGERKFLYNCFRKCFNHEFSLFEKDIFYLYLLIQNEFYSEMIQVNGRVGFENFIRYQNRKDLLFSSFPEYDYEAKLLAIKGTLNDNPIKSLEARITPKNNREDIYESIKRLDSFLDIDDENNIDNLKFFYVIHFIKIPLSDEQTSRFEYLNARNYKSRVNTEMQAKAIMLALETKSYLRKRIRGMDACSREIGCRPETFATDFRYLREESASLEVKRYDDNSFGDKLRSTFHTGEEFLDIIDGLRAIDETIRFLEFQRGDRLGHALALGINVKDFYESKNFQIEIPKQDLLDNIAWITNQCARWNIDIPYSLNEMFKIKSRDLLDYIYYNTLGENKKLHLVTYWNAYLLRGDNPKYYRSTCESASRYSKYYKQSYKNLESIRKDEDVRKFYLSYHFSKQVRQRGSEIEIVKIDGIMIDLFTKIQTKMQYEIMEKGVSIECNLTSNVLIGTLNKYDEHPVFKFNNYGLEKLEKLYESPQISVSINTDDQGVFSTSLENEYILLARSMDEKRDEKGNRYFSSEEIYDYIQRLRLSGNSQSFHYNATNLFN